MNISQSHLFNKMRALIIKKGQDPAYLDSNSNGMCHGLSMLHIYYHLIRKSKEFFQNIETLAEWNEKDPFPQKLDKQLDVFINNILWLQSSNFLVSNISQRNYTQLLNVLLTQDSAEYPKIDSKFSLPFVFVKEELVSTLKTILNLSQPILVTTPTHALSVRFAKDTELPYVLYDPDYKGSKEEISANEADERYTRELYFATIENLVDELEKIYKNTIAEENLQDNDKYLPFTLVGFATSASNIPYPEPVEMISQLITKRKDPQNALTLSDKEEDHLFINLANYMENVLDLEGYKNETAIYLATWLGNLEIVKFLVNAKANLDIIASSGGMAVSPLSTAFQLGWWEIADILMAGGADAHQVLIYKDEDHSKLHTPFSLLIQMGKLDEANKILNQLPLAEGTTPQQFSVKTAPKIEELFHFYALQGDLKTVEFLFNNGLNINVNNKQGQNILECILSAENFINAKHKDIIQFFVKNGGQLEYQWEDKNKHLLTYAAERKDTALAVEILKAQPNVDKELVMSVYQKLVDVEYKDNIFHYLFKVPFFAPLDHVLLEILRLSDEVAHAAQDANRPKMERDNLRGLETSLLNLYYRLFEDPWSTQDQSEFLNYDFKTVGNYSIKLKELMNNIAQFEHKFSFQDKIIMHP